LVQLSTIFSNLILKNNLFEAIIFENFVIKEKENINDLLKERQLISEKLSRFDVLIKRDHSDSDVKRNLMENYSVASESIKKID
jgi:hypothetical protein